MRQRRVVQSENVGQRRFVGASHGRLGLAAGEQPAGGGVASQTGIGDLVGRFGPQQFGNDQGQAGGGGG